MIGLIKLQVGLYAFHALSVISFNNCNK